MDLVPLARRALLCRSLRQPFRVTSGEYRVLIGMEPADWEAAVLEAQAGSRPMLIPPVDTPITVVVDDGNGHRVTEG